MKVFSFSFKREAAWMIVFSIAPAVIGGDYSVDSIAVKVSLVFGVNHGRERQAKAYRTSIVHWHH